MTQGRGSSVVLGIGVDLVKISRFGSLIQKKGGFNSRFTSKFSQRILHPTYELSKFNALINEKKYKECELLLAGSWATKEAVFKTLDNSLQSKFKFKDWYRIHDAHGKPIVGSNLQDDANEYLLSISHDNDLLIATVLRQKFL